VLELIEKAMQVAHLLFPVAADSYYSQNECLDGGAADHARPDSLEKEFQTKNVSHQSN
jgi:hypothetical protein